MIRDLTVSLSKTCTGKPLAVVDGLPGDGAELTPEQLYDSIAIRAEIGSITLAYNHTAHGRPVEAVNQTIPLEATACTLGGHRRWFACPGCGRRVAVIYGAGRLFACRRCEGLAYSSQAESAGDRALRCANRLRKQLGWPVGVAHGHGLKPVGMHQTTFDRLRLRHDKLVNIWLQGTAKWLGMV